MAFIMERNGKFWVRWTERAGKNRFVSRSRTVRARATAEIIKASIEHDLAVHGVYLGASASAARRRKERGYVYFAAAAGRIKIGYAVDVALRIRELQIGCPFPLTLLGTIAATPALEKRWHKVFRATHAHGEWFLASAELVDRIRKEAVLCVAVDRLDHVAGAHEVRTQK